jgi:hypothetical protein
MRQLLLKLKGHGKTILSPVIPKRTWISFAILSSEWIRAKSLREATSKATMNLL